MRTSLLFTLGVGMLVAAVSGLSLWRAKTLMERELGILTPQMDSMASDWEAKKVPLGSRVVTFLLSDTRAAFDPFLLAPEPEEGFADKAGGWISRNLIGGSVVATTPTALVRAFSDSTQLISWTHQGFSSVGELAMSRELQKAILKAHDAGAEINIVAQGTDAAAVLAALKRVEGMERGGLKVGANKVILLGVNAARLKRAGKSGNFLESAYVWSTREGGSAVQAQLFGGKRAGEIVNVEELWPGVGTGGDAVDKSVRLIRGFVESPKTLDQFVGEREALLRDARAVKASEAEARARTAAEEDSRNAARAAAVAAADARNTAPSRTAPAAKAAPAKAAPGPLASWNNWPTGRLYDYSQSMDGVEIGWVFSAPADKVENMPKEHMSLPFDTPGLTSEQCYQSIDLRAVPVRKLGPGEHDAALHALYESESRISTQKTMKRVATKDIHGRPAGLFKLVPEASDDSAGKRSEKTQFVVETGRHLIYLTHTIYYQPAVRGACVNSYTAMFQGIADSLRPAQ